VRVGRVGEWEMGRVRRGGDGEMGRVGKIFLLPSSFFLRPP